MDSQLIISIGREFGSAGHEIAQKLAEHYHIPLLDSNLLEEAALEKNMDAAHLLHLDEKHKKYGLYRTVRGLSFIRKTMLPSYSLITCERRPHTAIPLLLSVVAVKIF